jgi:crotonobetaine/carnitine-CoA ligase
VKLTLENTDERLFGKVLARQAADIPATPFLVTDRASISFGETEAETNRLAAGLAALGIGAGDRVVLYLSNRPEMVLLALAVNKLSAIWVPINTDYRGAWLADAIAGSRPALVITELALLDRFTDLGHQGGARLVVMDTEAGEPADGTLPYDALHEHGEHQSDYSAQSYGDTCAILWTSGTTGRSKGVMQSYNNWIRAIVNGASVAYDSSADDICYCALPLYNSAAWLTCIYRCLIEGIPCVIDSKFSVTHFWERINQFGATQTFALGAMGSFLMAQPEDPDDINNSLRRAYIVPMAPQLWQTFEQRFGVQLISSGLGMSECLMIMNHNDCGPGIPSYALGLPPADLEVALCDDAGELVAAGTPGEICIRPRVPFAIFNGYFDNPEATAAAFRDDWFLTGDLARFDPDIGAYFFADRKKDAVRFAGRNISTLEVESVVRRHPDVADVAAYGIPAAELADEDELKLSVVRKPGSTLTAETLCTFINTNAPHFFVPRYLDFVDSLPYTPTQKVQKYQLREQGNSADTWDRKLAGFEVSR